jgi:hypothetical protein
VVVAASEVAAVGGAGEAAVGDPDDPGQRPVAQVGFDLADQGLVAGVAGPAPHPDRDAGAGDRHADHDLRQVVAVVLGLAVAANPRLLAVTIAVAGLGQPVAALVPGDRRIRLIQLEVGGGGVEEQQVDLEVEEVGDLAEHLALQGGVDLQQPVHRPVAGVIGRLGQPRDGHVVADPAGGGQLRRRGQRPVGDQANSTRSARSSSRRPFSSRRIVWSIPRRCHSPSSAQTPPSGRDSMNSRPWSAVAASARSGSRNRETEATRRCSAARLLASSRPKL